MAEAKIRIQLDSEKAKRKLSQFDDKRERARKKAEKAEKRRARREQPRGRAGLLGAAAGAVVAARSPQMAIIQQRAEMAGGTVEKASHMITELMALVTAAEAAGNTLSAVAGAVEAQGTVGKIIAEPLKAAAAGLKASAVPKTLLETAQTTASAFAPFASAGIPLSPEQVAEVAKFAKYQAEQKAAEELRDKAKVGKAVGNVIAKIVGLGG